MDYKEKYEKAVQAAMLAKQDTESAITIQTLEEIFPELRVSEEERIRKEMIEIIKNEAHEFPASVIANKSNSWIAWLEKQGEHANFINNIQVGDKVTRNKDGVLINLSQLNRVAKKQGENSMGISEATKQKLEDNLNKALEKETPESWNEFLDEQDEKPQGKSALEAIKEVKVDNQNCVKSADKVEPKFKVGDILVSDEEDRRHIYKVDAITNYDTYLLLDLEDGYTRNESVYTSDLAMYLWTIQDAKDGDVLVNESGLLFIYNGYLEEKQWPFAHGGINIYDRFAACGGLLPFTHGKVTPATKEQRDLLFQKMKESGYEWDAEKKELKKIEQKSTEDVDLPEFESYLCLMLQKFRTKGMCTNGEIIDYVKEHSQKLRGILVKPTWSEEDEKMLQVAISDTFDRAHLSVSDWLKSLKYRILPKQEWSEEDKDVLEDIEEAIINYWHGDTQDTLLDWLKSLKDRVQPRQEWSIEDKKCIKLSTDIVDSALRAGFCVQLDRDRCVDWLNSLRPQNTWKPNDEQMMYLSEAIDVVTRAEKFSIVTALKELREQLKKLREE